METHCKPLRNDPSLPKLVQAHLDDAPELHPFRNYPPTPEGYQKALRERQLGSEKRKILTERTIGQYERIDGPGNERVKAHLKALEKEAFTVTTGHQLQLLTGPLLYIHKTLHTIRLAETLQEQYPEQRIVPVHWMASEDHDLPEVDHVQLHGEQFRWKTEQKGAVGRMRTDGISALIEQVKSRTEGLPYTEEWVGILEKAYREGMSLADATRKLLDQLFGEHGLVVVDGDDPELKKLFVEDMKEEVERERGRKAVERTDEALESAGFGLQVHPRKINLFHLEEGKRERIEEREGSYFTLDGSKQWNKGEILAEIELSPERFSPNVILRPLYQERILPNLAYVGGPAEIAYWHQLKGLFDEADAFFPLLQLRSRIFHLDGKCSQLLNQCELAPEELLQEKEALIQEKVREKSAHDLELKKEEEHLATFYQELAEKASGIDPNLYKSVMAEARKTEKGLERVRKKMIRHAKKKEGILTQRIERLYKALYPNGSAQERVENIAPFYGREGTAFIRRTGEAIHPMEAENIWIVDKGS